MPAVVLALGATLNVVGPNGEKQIRHRRLLRRHADDVSSASRTSSAKCASTRVPAGSGAAYQKFDQPASHYALTGVCAVVSLDGDKLGSVRARSDGRRTQGVSANRRRAGAHGPARDDEAVKAAVQGVADGIDVMGDIHASPDYRAHLARVLTRRAVLEAAQKARG